MEKKGEAEMGSKHFDLIKSFKLAIRSLLTPCTKEVVASLRKDLEEEFESLCTETQVGSVLDTLDQLVEEQSLDSMFLKKTNIMDVADKLSTAKKNEIECLTGMLEKGQKTEWPHPDSCRAIQEWKSWYLMVVASLHKDLEEEFESLCTETQVGSVLDTLDQLVEEQSLDSMFLKKCLFTIFTVLAMLWLICLNLSMSLDTG